MATFDFLLMGSNETLQVEVEAKDVFELAHQMAREKFLVGELTPDDCGEIKRVIFPSQRVTMVLETD